MKKLIFLALSGLLAASCTSAPFQDDTFPRPGETGVIDDAWRHDPRKPDPGPTLYQYGERYQGGPSGNEIWLSIENANAGIAAKQLAGEINDFAYLRTQVELGTREAHVVAIMSTQAGARSDELAADRWFFSVAGPSKDPPAWSVTLSVWASHHDIWELLRVDFAESGSIERICVRQGVENETFADGKRIVLPHLDRDRNSCATENVDALATQLGTARNVEIVTPASAKKQGQMTLHTAGLLSAIELTQWMISRNKVQSR